MKKKWKIILPVVIAIAAVGTYFVRKEIAKRNLVTVQTARSARQDLTALVTASGEIKPRNYINIGTNANVPSRIIDIVVTEGQRVRKGQLLAKLESVQPEAEVAAQRAQVATSEAESTAAESGVRAAEENQRSAEASLTRAKADLDRSKIFYDRAQKLWDEQLIPRQELDQRNAEYRSQLASITEAEARIAQFKAQRAQAQANMISSQRRVTVSQANLRRAADVLQRTQSVSPIDGVVTNLPVRVGETVVPGIQNSASSLIMTIADMSLITAEVKVDETDIVNVSLNQIAEITIDAIPDRTFKGHVIEIGNTAILRSTGLAASQSAISSQEAKDFKVVVALDNPPEEIRPGLSATAKITTATRKNVVTIPIQALTVRQKGDLEPEEKDKKKEEVQLDPAAERARKEEIQGVFVIENEKAVFKKVDTGITGSTDIEVTSGIGEGAEIITGSYKVIRTLRNEATVKVDNKAPKKVDS